MWSFADVNLKKYVVICKRSQHVFLGCDLLQIRTYILHVIICRWERIFKGVIFVKIKLWKLGSNLLKKMTTHRIRLYLQKITTQILQCHLSTDHNAFWIFCYVIFSQMNMRFLRCDLFTDYNTIFKVLSLITDEDVI